MENLKFTWTDRTEKKETLWYFQTERPVLSTIELLVTGRGTKCFSLLPNIPNIRHHSPARKAAVSILPLARLRSKWRMTRGSCTSRMFSSIDFWISWHIFCNELFVFNKLMFHTIARNESFLVVTSLLISCSNTIMLVSLLASLVSLVLSVILIWVPIIKFINGKRSFGTDRDEEHKTNFIPYNFKNSASTISALSVARKDTRYL